MDELIRKLVKIELELNSESNIPVGSLLANNWRSIYYRSTNNDFTKKNIYINFFVKIYIISKHCFLILFNQKIKTNFILNGDTLVAKTANMRHYNRLIDFILENNNQSTLFQGNYKLLANEFNLLEKILIISKTLIFCILKFPKINKKIRNYQFQNYNFDFDVLFFSVMNYFISLNFFKAKKINKLVVDFDRGKFLSLVAAAKQQNIHTITLQHGVIDTSYGYFPLIAHQIWVWGNHWKKVLTNIGVNQSSIKIVGSTIVDDYRDPKTNRVIKTIGIGPNPLGISRNRALWNTLSSNLRESGFNIIVKLHPSMKREEYFLCFHESCSIYEANELDNHDFFEKIDLLVVSSSGLGYESIIYGTPVAVIRESNVFMGNDSLMIESGSFIEIESSKYSLNEAITQIESMYSSYIVAQQQFLKNQIFECTGNTAERKVLNELKNV